MIRVRCEYRFKVHGKLRLNQSHPITVNGHVYRFHITPDSGRVEAITVEVRADDAADWPTVTRLAVDPRIPKAPKFHINIPSPAWNVIRDELQTVEGLLSLYGLDAIDATAPQRRYIPDTESEAQHLAVNDFQVNSQPRPDSEFPISGFDVVARSVLAVNDTRELQVALSFFRKGRLDMHADRFIDAFYDFFFVIETLFAEGNSRTRAMMDAFSASPILLNATRDALAGEGLALQARNRPEGIGRLKDRYIRDDPIETLAALVETRGFLHHHSRKRPDAWHPDRHADFGVDAVLIEQIAFHVVFELTHEAIFSDAAVKRYQALFSGTAK
jgi:hypothetical protein